MNRVLIFLTLLSLLGAPIGARSQQAFTIHCTDRIVLYGTEVIFALQGVPARARNLQVFAEGTLRYAKTDTPMAFVPVRLDNAGVRRLWATVDSAGTTRRSDTATIMVITQGDLLGLFPQRYRYVRATAVFPDSAIDLPALSQVTYMSYNSTTHKVVVTFLKLK